MATILKGGEVARAKKSGIMKRVDALKERGICPALCIVMVGDRKDSHAYVKGATKALTGCGIDCHLAHFPEGINQNQLLEEINAINKNPEYNGIIVMRPVPDTIRWGAIEEAISPEKDVDCITIKNLSKLFKGEGGGFYPCTAKAVVDTLDHYGIKVEGKKVVVVGRSLVVGKPAAMLLLQRNATVTICHSKTLDLGRITSEADIIVAAAGVPHLLGANSVNRESIVLDVGINVVDGKLTGDVDFDRVEPLVSMITPVPGGVGSVTTSVLMENIVTAAQRLAGEI
ncbi:MAG: tetrahydrofolate dehydrogenase/cyclohydrolase catalytic domain-containing protein [Bacillota bacterium]|jgi:methylenetetrahydrofolate dehydrogenase (NADP+)/methenyltetrahydrofolate cyclohydrolase|nr:tetrahydrofolate dehydrogenase/cyclohydrolase catalytic domain-containing protein [Bacillota bacterium]MDD3297455.1 tetrahydrofolate dehydrogenase/cyclohydrolase catalytic domain-containing protein [Bacillota bacterium]MDD3850267.1 tetrahydrofolate dehydrogenase/cyclohydrolase catalytic domain-containing protein [Bacillota bacterium]MDD4707224.1 tetrahydrofolate dehydrogenase/cyclohydrolase catalytic domain-containing protein [Bacillota bacterium]